MTGAALVAVSVTHELWPGAVLVDRGLGEHDSWRLVPTGLSRDETRSRWLRCSESPAAIASIERCVRRAATER